MTTMRSAEEWADLIGHKGAKQWKDWPAFIGAIQSDARRAALEEAAAECANVEAALTDRTDPVSIGGCNVAFVLRTNIRGLLHKEHHRKGKPMNDKTKNLDICIERAGNGFAIKIEESAFWKVKYVFETLPEVVAFLKAHFDDFPHRDSA